MFQRLYSIDRDTGIVAEILYANFHNVVSSKFIGITQKLARKLAQKTDVFTGI